ncbi:MAG: ATPase [Clostridiaceae bacterium]|nr:ATPase [Clostridiaceae bacterium]
MALCRARHMFPGGNTCKGFFSYYDYIMPQENAVRIIILKGGPGVGKSSFMRHIAEHMLSMGFDVEFMHCSSDPDSLDGVVIPEKKTALMDGTAPHVVDPKNPGAVDEIINLGDFWNKKGFSQTKDKILFTNNEIKKTFKRAYKYIQAAYSIYEDNMTIYNSFMDHGKANLLISGIIDKIFGNIGVSDSEGKKRHLFASAITPKGMVNYLPSLITTKEVYIVKGKPGTGTERLLERVRLAASERGFYTESFYCGLNPYKLEHLIIPDMDISFTTSNTYHQSDVDSTEIIDFDLYLNKNILFRYTDIINFNDNEIENLLNMAVQTINRAKIYHDELESYYIPNMNFSEVTKCRDETLARLLQVS